MKHIKEYNHTYYHSISELEFQNLIYSNGPDEDMIVDTFSNAELKLLKGYAENDDLHRFTFSHGTKGKFAQYTNRTTNCVVFKISDEWYLINISRGKPTDMVFDITYNYKCDQFEGLVEFLQKVLFKK